MTDTPSPGGGSPDVGLDPEVLDRWARVVGELQARVAMLVDFVKTVRRSSEISSNWAVVEACKMTLAATDADVSAWLEARERAAAEKAIAACNRVIMDNFPGDFEEYERIGEWIDECDDYLRRIEAKLDWIAWKLGRGIVDDRIREGFPPNPTAPPWPE